MTFDVTAVKKDFPILERRVHGRRLVFLDSAASSQRPRAVLDAMDHYYETTHANVHRGVYTIADMSAWGWVDRAARVFKGEADPLVAFPNVGRWFKSIDARPAAALARAVGRDHVFKKEVDEETKRALFPSNYPASRSDSGRHVG